MNRPHVVVLGCGFGGLSAVQALRRAPVEITVIDRHNHHLFQPLLYQVATASLSESEIAGPIRTIVRRERRVNVVLGEVTGIDLQRRVVEVDEGRSRRLPYDVLVVATGSRDSYFGHPEWEQFAPGLKTLDDATLIRRRVLLAFERAENEDDSEERRRLLSFVIVGGGSTGVEMAGAVSELARQVLKRDFRAIDTAGARIVLVEGGDRLLAGFAPDSSAYAARALGRLGVEQRLGSMVSGVDADGVELGDGTRIAARTVIWAAGVRASPAAEWLAADHDKSGRVKVTDRLTLPGHPEVFVVGDTALLHDDRGREVPGLAPAAKEAGSYVARVIAARLENRDVPPFRYRHYGNLTTIGRGRAVVEFGRLHLHGFFAWLMWSVAHILFLIGFRNRLAVTLSWLWSYLTYTGGVRLITGPAPE